MRVLIAALAAVLALGWLMPTEADARKRGWRTAGKPAPYTYYRRPASVGANGLCQRDTGTPTSQLNFRNVCDTEEFWRRIQERGGRR